jgi:hypothetical protein
MEKLVWKFTFNYLSTYSIGSKAHMQRHSANFCSWYLLKPNTIQNNEWHFIFISRETNKYMKEIWEHWKSSYLSSVSTASQSNVNFFFFFLTNTIKCHPSYSNKISSTFVSNVLIRSLNMIQNVFPMTHSFHGLPLLDLSSLWFVLHLTVPKSAVNKKTLN